MANMRLQRVPRILTPSSQCFMDVERGPCRAQWIIVMSSRGAKKRHDSVADVLVDRAAVADDDVVHERGEARHQLMNLLGVQGS